MCVEVTGVPLPQAGCTCGIKKKKNYSIICSNAPRKIVMMKIGRLGGGGGGPRSGGESYTSTFERCIGKPVVPYEIIKGLTVNITVHL